MAASEGTRRTDPRATVLVVQIGLMLIALLLLASWWESGSYDPETFTWRIAAAYTLHTAWAFGSWRLLTRRWVDAYTVFLLSLVLFSGGQLMLHAFGLLPDGVLGRQFQARTMERTALLVNASLIAFHLGAVLRCPRQRHAAGPSGLAGGSYAASLFRWLGYVFVAAALPLKVASAIESVQLVASSGYFALYHQPVRTGLAHWQGIVGSFFFPGLLILLATKPHHRWNVRLCWMLAFGSIGVYLFYGTRAAALTALLPLLMLHHLVVRRIRPALALSVGVGLLIVIPVVGSMRDLSLQDRIFMARSGAVLDSPPTIAAVEEMGGSMGTVAHTIELVPARRAIEGGAGYARAALTVFPNVFWDIHPAAREGTYAQWLIREVDPAVYEAGGGIGFSMIAEAYLNGGLWGGIFVMLVAGFLLSAFVAWTRERGDVVHYTLEALVLSALLFLPRAESVSSVRAIAWNAVVPYLVARYAPRRGSQAAIPEASEGGGIDDVEHVRRGSHESASVTWT